MKRGFDEEALKFDSWSDDLKCGLEREIKDIDREIRDARKTTTLAEKREFHRTIKDLEGCRIRKGRDLFDAQDDIDRQRDERIGRIKAQFKPKQTMTSLVTMTRFLV